MSVTWKSTKTLTLALVAAMLILPSGCGARDGVKMGEVQGKVLLDGQPLTGARVKFFPEGGSPSIGQTDSEGNYELYYSSTKSGALAGVKHTVWITTGQQPREDDDGKPIPAVPERVPAKYNARSELIADVQPKSNTIDFDLKTK